MKLCFIADARSPIAQNWVSYFIATGHEVHFISTYPCEPDSLPVASLHVVPVAFSWLAGSLKGGAGARVEKQSKRSSWIANLKGGVLSQIANQLRFWLGPIDVYRFLKKVRRIVGEIQPDIVHAMRLPFEGILAAQALRSVPIPLLISVWGNDFTLFGQRFPLMGQMTRQAMKRANALHSDCHRDIRLAKEWGYDSQKPTAVLPGGGGIQKELFHPGSPAAELLEKWSIPANSPVVLNPRGFRYYVRNDTFFRSIPLVLEDKPDALFLGLAMQGNAAAENWIQKLKIGHAVRLLPPVSRNEMADFFRLADVLVSPSEHDGTPNTLLEGMACGAFPVAGDIESIREWLENGVNGILCDPANPQSLAKAILRALEDESLRQQAAVRNQELIAKRAEYQTVMASAEDFYRQVITDARESRS